MARSDGDPRHEAARQAWTAEVAEVNRDYVAWRDSGKIRTGHEWIIHLLMQRQMTPETPGVGDIIELMIEAWNDGIEANGG